MDLKLHKNTIFQPEPWAIISMALCEMNQSQRRVAVVRRPVPTKRLVLGSEVSPTRIEIWNMTRPQVVVEQVIEDSHDQATLVEQVAWAGHRLLSCGMTSNLYEYDLEANRIKSAISVPTGGCWCLSVNSDSSKVAVGTEEGYIVIYSLLGEEIIQETSLKNSDRILSLAWHNDLVVSGSHEFIKVWNLTDGRPLEQIRVGDSETCIWSLIVLPGKRSEDFTIISADSKGCTAFWSGATGTEIASFREHTADVIALAISKDGNRLYSSGVDPKVVLFTRASNTGKWAPSLSYPHHKHDVRSLLCLEPDWILSGGTDSHLFKVRGPPRITVRFQQPSTQSVRLTSRTRKLLMTASYSLEVWTTGSVLKSANLVPDQNVPLAHPPLKLANLTFTDRIISSDLSDDWLIVAVAEGIFLYHISLDCQNISNRQVIQVPTDFEVTSPSKSPMSRVLICNEKLAAVVTGCTLTFLKLDPTAGASDPLRFTFPTFTSHIYSNGSYLIAVENRRKDWNLRTFSLINLTGEPSEDVDPLYISCPLVSIAFDPLASSHAWLLTSDRRLLHFNMASGELLDSLHLAVPDDHFQLDGLTILNTKLPDFASNPLLQQLADQEPGSANPSPRKKARKAKLQQLNPPKDALKELPPIESRLLFHDFTSLYGMKRSQGTGILVPIDDMDLDCIVSVDSPVPTPMTNAGGDGSHATTVPDLIVTQFTGKSLFALLPPTLAKKKFGT